MAFIAETYVEEWLNRQGYFTIRGVKKGHEEMDLLAVRAEDGGVTGWHVEVTVSFRPIGYIAREPAAGSGRGSFVRKRTPDQARSFAKAWIEKKFAGAAKLAIRDRLWPGARWSRHLVHGAVRYPDELLAFEAEGVTCHPFHRLLSDLSQRGPDGFTVSAGGDLAEILTYFKRQADKTESSSAAAGSECGLS